MSDGKEIRRTIDALHNTIKRDIDKDAIMLITPLVLQSHARILDLTSQLAEISSATLERQTDKVINLTRWLCVYTCILVIMTVVLVVLTYLLIKHG